MLVVVLARAAVTVVVMVVLMMMLVFMVRAAAVPTGLDFGRWHMKLFAFERLGFSHGYSPSLPVSSAAWLMPTLMSVATCWSARR